ncbi:hypothetical protein [Bradyrhizobium sp. SZCCHNRI3052]|uniref:hypothetical protein n=1 Tax=Bradyrhizobium sp. SZCCHNRI3052 TaxID=3057295 RepID=UPI00291619E9|nr:hypothetical protein [Bradyrhizobium sp. SZCCHNRI3052]
MSPYISLTRSYGVAEAYAIDYSKVEPTRAVPAHVYEIDVPPSAVAHVVDPVIFIASQQGDPLCSPSYHHDGDQSFLKYVVDPALRALPGSSAPTSRRPPGMGLPAPAKMQIEFEAMALALRDAEILLEGRIPKEWILHRYEVF